MKRKYIVPEIVITQVITESMLDGVSGSGADYFFEPLEKAAKERESFWNSWENEEETLLIQSKSVWDD